MNEARIANLAAIVLLHNLAKASSCRHHPPWPAMDRNLV
jgi:hypothetical protein